MKKLSAAEIDSLMYRVSDGVLALTDGSRPYCLPFGFVWIKKNVYLSLFPRGRKWQLMQQNPAVCFTVFAWNDDHTAWSSVVLDGTLEQVTDLAEIEQVVRANMRKMQLDPDTYLDQRMDYYRQKQNDPDHCLQIFKLRADDVQGRSMPMLAGR